MSMTATNEDRQERQAIRHRQNEVFGGGSTNVCAVLELIHSSSHKHMYQEYTGKVNEARGLELSLVAPQVRLL
ncbi:hypothetical protein Q7C36_010867 [Tachysurus vachellii]|uniref:Uncharacterized protein n=1 Tax=Tachysurus vachellii TaxID=175792 RepID=A0AA88MZU7_TACVA|nr:hypothetical protein Q7C36_010867 [Tachysurus vachellii]